MRRTANIVRAVGGAAGLTSGLGWEPAWAHAFGERYDLPLPFELYLAGAAAAVAVTFLIIGVLVRDGSWARSYPRLNLLDYRIGRLVAHPAVVRGVQLVSVLLFLLVVAAGTFGNQDPVRNIAPVLVWVVWWVGVALVSAFAGDLWAVVNPWRTLFGFAEALWRRLKPGGKLSLDLPLPSAVGLWPAVALLLAFTWSELISPRPAVPAYVASMAILYSLLTWTGMLLFGRERWLRQGEVFAVFFGVLARFAPTEAGVARNGAREWVLRPYAVGLLRSDDVSTSMIGFVLLYLASVIYDGVLLTPAWAWFEALLVPAPTQASLVMVRTAGLIGLWLGCTALYLVTCRAMAAFAGGHVDAGSIARSFVLTLVPIGIAYHLAHYLTYLLIQGQHVIPLVSDPFGWGWNLFGTADYRIDVGVVGARFTWYAALTAIVAGHVVAVILGHARAMATFAGPRPALRGECPMIALMVAFTVASLSILAEPILQKAPAAADSTSVGAVAVPPEALRAEAGSGRLLPVGPGRTAALKLTYGAMASPYHDGTAVAAADVLYPFAAAYRWGGGEPGAKNHDPAIAAATALMRSRLKGFKSVGADTSRTIRFGDLTYAREQLLVDVFVDAPTGDLETMASLAPPWSPLPWHVIALMEEAVARGWAAFSEPEARRLGVEWLDPVRSEPLKQRLKALVQEFERDGFIPPPLSGFVTEAEARARWKALAEFHAKFGHFLVTNGPYVVKSWADGAAVLDVVRDPRYPLGVGSFDAYAIPRRARVVQAEPGADGLVLTVEIETIDRVMRDFKIVGRSLREAVAGFGRGMIPQCRYVVVDAGGRIALAGQGRFRDDGAMLVDLKGKLASGRYTVSVALYPHGNTVDAEIRRIPYDVP